MTRRRYIYLIEGDADPSALERVTIGPVRDSTGPPVHLLSSHRLLFRIELYRVYFDVDRDGHTGPLLQCAKTVVTSIRVTPERSPGCRAGVTWAASGRDGAVATAWAGPAWLVHPAQRIREMMARHWKKQEKPVRVCIGFHCIRK